MPERVVRVKLERAQRLPVKPVAAEAVSKATDLLLRGTTRAPEAGCPEALPSPLVPGPRATIASLVARAEERRIRAVFSVQVGAASTAAEAVVAVEKVAAPTARAAVPLADDRN